MKKKVAVVMAALLAVSMLAGCGEEKARYVKDLKISKYVTMSSDYTGLPLSLTPKQEITDDSVNEVAIASYSNGVTKENGAILDRAVKQGDNINLDYSGKMDGVVFEGGTATNQQLNIGNGGFIDGFESGLVGVMTGETVDLDVTFPDPYDNNPDFAGKPAVFTVTVNFIYPSTVSELKDEIVSSISSGQYTSVKQYIDECRAYMEDVAQTNYDNEKESAIITALEGIATFTSVPQSVIDKYSESLTDTLTQTAEKNGVDIDTLCNYYFQSDAATYIKTQAEASARQAMIFQLIANEQNLNVSDEELEKSLQDMVTENEIESVEALVGDTDREDFREYFMYQKVVDYLFENAVVTDK